jgi:hypothetical protein
MTKTLFKVALTFAEDWTPKATGITAITLVVDAPNQLAALDKASCEIRALNLGDARNITAQRYDVCSK